MNRNPIADLLKIPALQYGKQEITVNGTAYELYAAHDRTCEGLYRINPGFGVGNPCFTLHWTPAAHHAAQLGQYLAGRRGVKRAQAEEIVATAAVSVLRADSA
jgi:hypothetical protein